MAREQVTLDSYRCDGCGKEKYAAQDDEPPFGYHGTVYEISAHGGSGGADYYACRLACVRVAVAKSVERAWKA